MIVVDTNVWSELAKLEPARRVIEWEAQFAPQLRMPTIALAEWRAGASLMPEGRNRDALSAIIKAVTDRYADRLLIFDADCARWYGTVLADARTAGRPIATADAMIAATARSHGMAVATRNLSDFAGAGVELIDPWTA
jgi:toxin FitB